MLNIYRPSEDELMAEARAALQSRIAQGAVLQGDAGRIAQLRDQIGPAPLAFENPSYGTPGYALAHTLGWISKEEAYTDRAAYEERRRRSLQTCHRHSLYERPRFDPPRESGAYVPELAARLEDDRNLTDGARRCARKIAELAYRQNREGRCLDVTISYLMKALGRCRRTVQRYLRLLEREGYIRADVIMGDRSRLCVGLVVRLLGPLFARHHRKGWPERCRNPDATPESQNQRFKDSSRKSRGVISSDEWALRCMDGVFRSVMKTVPPLTVAP